LWSEFGWESVHTLDDAVAVIPATWDPGEYLVCVASQIEVPECGALEVLSY